jgi:hypothetical protein
MGGMKRNFPMKTIKQTQVQTTVNQLHNLGLSLIDTAKLAKLIVHGIGAWNQEAYAGILYRSVSNQGIFLRFAGEDLVIYSQTGYAVIEPNLGEVTLCYMYEEGTTLEDKTAAFLEV